MELVSVEEEVSLTKRIREGDQVALQKLTKANLRFVVSVAKQYHKGNGMTLGDLINEGNIGLIKAATRFDETRGFKFISYAVWWIRQSIMQAIAEHSRVIRLPLNRVNEVSRIFRTYSVLEQELEREPSDEEVAQAMAISTQDVENGRRFSGHQQSLDAPLNAEGASSLHDLLYSEASPSPESDLMAESLKQQIAEVLSKLTAREASIIQLFFGLDGREAMRLDDIAAKLDLSTERIRQIKEKAIRKLQRDGSERNLLKSFL